MKNIIKTIAFHNLGCKVNAYELNVVKQSFEQKGYRIVPFDENADIYVINTCTVTNIADRKSRQMLHQAKKRNPDAVVVALGCYVQTGKSAAGMDSCIDLAIGNNRKKDTAELVEAFLQKREPYADAVIDISHTDEYEEMQLVKTGEHTRAYIKIQDGCNQFCSYCIIPYARGRVRSRCREDICREIRGLAAGGCKEFVLTGIHISSYGCGTDDELTDLIEDIHEIPGVERIRIGSLEPRIVTDVFVQKLSSMPKICPHFHLSLQSGCDETLKRMNRHYTTDEYRRGVELLRSCFENPAITTDVIVGFPGETKEEFLQTKRFLEEMRFFEMHIFPYSLRKGTLAAKMPKQTDGETKKKRVHELLKLEAEQSKEYRVQFIGKTEEVLWEEAKEIRGKRCVIGHTKRYVKAAREILPDEDANRLSGRITEGVIAGMLTDEILSMSISDNIFDQ